MLDIDGTLIDSMPWPCDSMPHLEPAHIVEVGFVCTMQHYECLVFQNSPRISQDPIREKHVADLPV